MRELGPPIPLLGRVFVNKDRTATIFLLQYNIRHFGSPDAAHDLAFFIRFGFSMDFVGVLDIDLLSTLP